MRRIYILFISVFLSNFLLANTDLVIEEYDRCLVTQIEVSADTIWAQVHYNYYNAIEKRLVSNDSILASFESDIFRYQTNKMKLDDQNRLWVCTSYDGIVLIDGEDIINFTTDNGLPHNHTNDVFFDGDTVWVATNGGLGKLYNRVWHPITEDNGLPENYTSSVLKDNVGNLWVGFSYSWSDFGLAKKVGNRWVTYGETNGLGDNMVNDLLLSPSGVLWIGTDNGLSKFDNGVITTYTESDGLIDSEIEEIGIDSYNRIWAAEYYGGISILDGSSFTSFSDDELLGEEVYKFSWNNGKMYAGTTNGLMIFDEEQTEFEAWGYPIYYNSAIALDDYNNLWLAMSYSGLIYVKDTVGQWTVEDPQNGIDHHEISKIDFAPDGTVWISTYGNGIFQKSGNQWIQHCTATSSAIQHDYIVDFDFDGNGNVWAVSWYGAFYFNGIEWSNLMVDDGLISNDIECVLIDNRENIWFGYYSRGLSRYDGNNFSHFSVSNGLPNDSIVFLNVDEHDTLWVCTRDGMSKLKNNRIENVSFEAYWDDNYVADLYLGDDIILYTNPTGYNVGIQEDGNFVNYNLRSLYGNVFEVEIDNNGTIWMASYDGGLFYITLPPDVDFELASPPCVGTEVELVCTSTESNASYEWDINNDGIIDYTTESVSFLFEESGVYEIMLRITNEVGTNYIIKNVEIYNNPMPTIESLGTGFAKCAENDLELLVSSEYETYIWNTGSEMENTIADDAGEYAITVIDAHGCSGIDSVDVENYPVPEVNVMCDPVFGYICPEGEIATLSVSTDADIVAWSNGSPGDIITVDNQGVYYVYVEDTQGCEGVGHYEVKFHTPAVEQIGVVTASNQDEFMIVAWEKSDTTNIESYNIYRETGSAYNLIGEVPYSARGLFFDYDANYRVQAHSYKITTVDQCGTESSLDDCVAHTSMHLQQSIFQNDHQLSWTSYQGVDVLSYTIYEIDAFGIMTELNTVGAGNTTYTIVDYEDGKSYRVGVDLPQEVDPSVNTILKSESGPYSQALSNIAEMEITAIDVLAGKNSFILYPFVVSTFVNIQLQDQIFINSTLSIINSNGRTVYQVDVLTHDITLDISNLHSGAYLLKLENESGKTAIRKFVKQ